MNEIQKHQLNMALEVDRICKKYNIKYSLDGGTLLGAIRHKGFIPWDDDLDINMLRKDYNKFLEVAQKELGEKYFLQTVDTDKHYGLTIAKIRENNTLYVEKMSENVDINSGIYIDIFPFDNAPKNKFVQKLFLKNYIFFRMMLLAKENYTIETNSILKKIELVVIRFVSIFFSKKFILKIMKRIENKYNHSSSNGIICYNTVYFNKAIHDKSLFHNLIDVDFEGHKLSGFKNYDHYLTYLYGDYMTPLPEGERENRHGIIKVELDVKKNSNNP